MRRLVVFSLAAVAAALAVAPSAEAQNRRRLGDGGPLILDVRPRSYLDAGNVVPAGSLNRYAGEWQARSYLNTPPWHNMRDRFGEGSLPDPITNGPFVGARNPFGPIDYVAPPGFAR